MNVNVLAVACPFCGAPIRGGCTKPGMPNKAREALTSIVAHPSRIVAAAVTAGYSEAEAEALASAAGAGQAHRVRADWATKDAAT